MPARMCVHLYARFGRKRPVGKYTLRQSVVWMIFGCLGTFSVFLFLSPSRHFSFSFSGWIIYYIHVLFVYINKFYSRACYVTAIKFAYCSQTYTVNTYGKRNKQKKKKNTTIVDLKLSSIVHIEMCKRLPKSVLALAWRMNNNLMIGAFDFSCNYYVPLISWILLTWIIVYIILVCAINSDLLIYSCSSSIYFSYS